MCILVIRTGQGEFTARYSANGLTELTFPQPTPAWRAGEPVPSELRTIIAKWHRITCTALNMILTGRPPLELPPLDVVTGTVFQREVWQGLLAIPWGKTSSYARLARSIGRPKAVRAVGGACGANPIPVFIPCHRVLAAQGRVGGFSSGLDWERKLLAAEGWQEKFENSEIKLQGKAGDQAARRRR